MSVFVNKSGMLTSLLEKQTLNGGRKSWKKNKDHLLILFQKIRRKQAFKSVTSITDTLLFQQLSLCNDWNIPASYFFIGLIAETSYFLFFFSLLPFSKREFFPLILATLFSNVISSVSAYMCTYSWEKK